MAAVIAALPLAVVMLLMCFGIWKALSDERSMQLSQRLPAAPLSHGAGIPWRRRLAAIVSHPSLPQVTGYISKTVEPALATVVGELAQRELRAEVTSDGEGISLTVHHGEGAADFVYSVRPVRHQIPAFALTDAARREGERTRYYQAEVFLPQGGRGYDIYGYDAEQVIADVISHYNRFRHYLYSSSS